MKLRSKRVPFALAAAVLVACQGNGGNGGDAGTTAHQQEAAPATETQPQTVSLWVPESAEFVFMSARGGDTEIYSASGPGGEWTNLTNSPGGDNWPVWSPDGSRIAFQSSREDKLDIYVMNADGTGATRLTDNPEHDYLPAWSPDGSQLTFASWRRETGDSTQANYIYIMNADGSGQRRLFPWSPGTSTWAVWSPDAKTFALSRKFGEQGADIVVVDPEGNLVRRLTDDTAANGAPAFSRDGRHVAFHADYGTSSEIVVIDVDGSGRRTVVAEGLNWYPGWSPDGRYLIYTGPNPLSPTGKFEVLSVSIEGGVPVVLADGPEREAEGRWKPLQ